MPPAVAIAGAAVVGAGATLYAGSQAAKAQKRAAQQASDTELQMYNQTRQDQTPYRIVGGNALYKLADMYGVSRPVGDVMPGGGAPSSPAPAPTAPGFGGVIGGLRGWSQRSGAQSAPANETATPAMTEGYDGFQASPGYQFRLGEGLKAIERSAAARGLLQSGGTLKALQRYGEGLASSEYENYANRLAALAGIGQTATNATQQAGAQAAQGISQATIAAGNARASSYANTGAAVTNGVNNALGGYLMTQSPMWGGGGGGGASYQQLGLPGYGLPGGAALPYG